jgi:hypothetical protein
VIAIVVRGVELIAGDLWRSQASYTGALVNTISDRRRTTLLLATELIGLQLLHTYAM